MASPGESPELKAAGTAVLRTGPGGALGSRLDHLTKGTTARSSEETPFVSFWGQFFKMRQSGWPPSLQHERGDQTAALRNAGLWQTACLVDMDLNTSRTWQVPFLWPHLGLASPISGGVRWLEGSSKTCPSPQGRQALRLPHCAVSLPLCPVEPSSLG